MRHTSEYRQYCYVENTAQQWRSSVHFRKSHFCTDQLDVQEANFSFTQLHRSGDSFPSCRFTHGRYSRSYSLGFGDWNISFITQATKPNKHNLIQCKHTNVTPINIDHMSTNTIHSGAGAMLYVFEDNEAVIKMIIKGRSPTMRHVSRTHRVVLDWLFDRINLDSKIQIRYIDSKHQIADNLTKGNFTLDEWNDLLHLFNISHFSSLRCTKKFSWISCITMAKRIPEQKEEERVVSKSRPAVMTISSYLMSSSSSAASSPIASKSPGMSGAPGKRGSRMNLAASASQVKLKDWYLGGLKKEHKGDLPHEREENSGETDNSECEPWYHWPAPQNNEACGKPLAGGSAEFVSSEFQ